MCMSVWLNPAIKPICCSWQTFLRSPRALSSAGPWRLPISVETPSPGKWLWRQLSAHECFFLSEFKYWASPGKAAMVFAECVVVNLRLLYVLHFCKKCARCDSAHSLSSKKIFCTVNIHVPGAEGGFCHHDALKQQRPSLLIVWQVNFPYTSLIKTAFHCSGASNLVFYLLFFFLDEKHWYNLQLFEYLRVIKIWVSCILQQKPVNISPFCFRLPDGFTQLRALAHLSLNDVTLQTLPGDIGK